MAYEPTNWKAGDVVTSAKLNNMEQGIAGAGPLIVHSSVDSKNVSTLDKTWQEIHDAKFALIISESEEDINIFLVSTIAVNTDVYEIYDSDETVYSCETADGYPHTNTGGPL